MRFGVVVFPGSNCDQDCYHVIRDELEKDVDYIWHTETNINHFDCIIVPGGFSYGDYLRCGAMASHSPVVSALRDFVEKEKYVIGICNGFQVLTEAKLLPGVLMINKVPKFVCKPVELVVVNANTPFTTRYSVGDSVIMPIAHMEGRYVVDKDTLVKMKRNGQTVFQYIDNPNGSAESIAGIVNEKQNVLGMMPHPERASNKLLGSKDGIKLFKSVIKAIKS